jgi:D-alanyl-D-alanine carboxypeptidase (penicillin-binding protein 5/6)
VRNVAEKTGPLISTARAAVIVIACAVTSAMSFASEAIAQSFQTLAPQAILMDAETGAVLFEKNADELMAPASMAKVMAVEVILNEVRQGRITPETEFTISENAWRRGGGASGGSSMFAQVNSRVKLSDLLPGIIVQSGNDASIAVAEGIAGSEQNFAGMMNARSKQIGLTGSTWRNSTGFGHPEQKTTARDLVKLTAHILETYPEFWPIFGQREFTWNKIRQQNRNPLLAMDIGADGVKTGNIEESGFGLIGSAVQNGQRLLLVVNGLKNSRDRAAEARKLLEWGFRAFEPRELFAAGVPLAEASVFGGAQGRVALVSKKPVRLLAPRGSGERLTARIVYDGPLRAPVAKGALVGRLRITRGDVKALEMPVYAAEDVEAGTLTQRAFDGLLEWGGGLIRQAFSRN